MTWLPDLPLSVLYQRLLRATGLTAWIYIFLMLQMALRPGHILPDGMKGIVWFLAWLIILPTFWASTSKSKHVEGFRAILLMIELVASFTMRWEEPRVGIVTILLLITWQAVMFFSLWVAVAWMVLQFVLHCASLRHEHILTLMSFSGAVVYLMYKMLTCGLIVAAIREADVRAHQTRMIAELNMRQNLLAESSRSAERLRISRELHDAMGHGLTALSLHLEVAINALARNDVDAHLRKAKDVTCRMLDDVRRVVGETRDARYDSNLSRSLDELVNEVPGLQIHISKPDVIYVHSEAQANASIRCIQEIITNTLKHASAENLWIKLVLQEGLLRITTRDDGQGYEPTGSDGFGLVGMRERFRGLGGDVEVVSSRGFGFRVIASLPLGVTVGAG